jgi:WD40 repeat protein
VNFDGPVRVADAAGSGTATITLSFDAWKAAAVAPTTHTLTVLPARAGPKDEPTASNLVASLIHPERMASFWRVEFSRDGARLLTTGYPSGIVQIWDVASRKEVHRIETPRGYRGSADYALLTPDWKTLYVPVQKRSVKQLQRDGRKQYRIEYSGEIRVWDMPSGKEKDPLRPVAGSAPVRAKLAPGGRYLLSVERPSYDSSADPKDVTMVWDLASGKKWKLCDGFVNASFLPDGKTFVAHFNDYESKTSVVKLLDLTTGKELAKAGCPEKGRSFSIGQVAPNGSVVAVLLGENARAPW